VGDRYKAAQQLRCGERPSKHHSDSRQQQLFSFLKLPAFALIGPFQTSYPGQDLHAVRAG
ncbi:hypothetical protein, partial [Novosphingobium sp. 17-62-19]|uniref:hypothetical protein n=1 Tax=Novosphingobium sp. 17-62-19 TaxID=1970406 RepID=UPI0025D993CB